MRRNCRKVFKVHNLEQSMIESSNDASVIWKNLPWKKFQKKLFRLQRFVYEAIQVGDKRKATSLQKLILKSIAARTMAVRQVTQLNAGKKTPGVDGLASLKYEERLELIEEIGTKGSNWEHQKLREIPIPKKDGTIRTLKIPTMADRAWQCKRKICPRTSARSNLPRQELRV